VIFAEVVLFLIKSSRYSSSTPTTSANKNQSRVRAKNVKDSSKQTIMYSTAFPERPVSADEIQNINDMLVLHPSSSTVVQTTGQFIGETQAHRRKNQKHQQ
jgi:hypothetical protein